jgi:hypothetical protein
LRRHPSFVQGDASPLLESADEWAQDFSFADPATGRSARLDISCTRLLAESLARFRTGLEGVVAGLGRSIAKSFGGAIEGTRSFLAVGLQAAETRLSGSRRTAGNIEEAMFGIYRAVIADDMLFVVSFTSYYPSREASDGGYTPLVNPLLKECGLPALDSLTFGFRAEGTAAD